MKIDQIIQNLYAHYNVNTLSNLAIKMQTTQPTLSKWKKSNSIDGLKKKCKQLGIYKNIFIEEDTPDLTVEDIFQLNSFFQKLDNYKMGILKNKEGFYLLLLDILDKVELNNTDKEFMQNIVNYPKIKRLKRGIIETKDLIVFLTAECSQREIITLIKQKDIASKTIFNQLKIWNRIL